MLSLLIQRIDESQPHVRDPAETAFLDGHPGAPE
jgi:hypothetical protein